MQTAFTLYQSKFVRCSLFDKSMVNVGPVLFPVCVIALSAQHDIDAFFASVVKENPREKFFTIITVKLLWLIICNQSLWVNSLKRTNFQKVYRKTSDESYKCSTREHSLCKISLYSWPPVFWLDSAHLCHSRFTDNFSLQLMVWELVSNSTVLLTAPIHWLCQWILPTSILVSQTLHLVTGFVANFTETINFSI